MVGERNPKIARMIEQILPGCCDMEEALPVTCELGADQQVMQQHQGREVGFVENLVDSVQVVGSVIRPFERFVPTK